MQNEVKPGKEAGQR